MRKKIIISAINFSSGGPLSIMNDCLSELSNNYSLEYEIIALVHRKELHDFPNIKYVEFPLSKKSWLIRLFYEYVYFYFFSLRVKPNYWLSMHDVTPNVNCKNRFVYCHNPTPFYSPNGKNLFQNPKIHLFSTFYKYLYRINIKKNKYVIVQQNWIKNEFINFWKLKNVLVAHPEIDTTKQQGLSTKEKINEKKSRIKSFFYPSFPRSFKNFEVICKAYSLLPNNYKNNCKIYLTIDESLNAYSKEIFKLYSVYKNINFLGLLSREEVYNYYQSADCLIFPSKLETWGLPITEFKASLKPIILANKPYAKETLGIYEKVAFFNVDSADELKELIIAFMDERISYDGNRSIDIDEPYTKGWQQLFDKIFEND